MPLANAELRAELEALAVLSTDALARVRAGDEAVLDELVARRERLTAALADQTVEADEAVLEAARRAVALDSELVAALRLRLAEMGREVETTMHTRRSLMSYGAPAGGSVFVERLG
jgi:hypothetical protein